MVYIFYNYSTQRRKIFICGLSNFIIMCIYWNYLFIRNGKTKYLTKMFETKEYKEKKIKQNPKSKFFLFIILFIFIILSLSRTYSLLYYYNAPIKVYHDVYSINPQNKNANVCVGKEWYRFTRYYKY
jgi:uncharacterized membrane protein SpoIIM required for sporulation